MGDENDFVIVGHPWAVILYKPPKPLPPDKEQLLTVIDFLGPYKDGFALALCRHRKIPELRAAGAEIIVIDPDANHYTMLSRTMKNADLVALIDKRVDEHRSDLAVARAGRDREQGGSGDDDGGDGGDGQASST